jgi:hypothetical protein
MIATFSRGLENFKIATTQNAADSIDDNGKVSLLMDIVLFYV